MTNRNVSKLPGELLPQLADAVVELIDVTLDTGVVAHFDSVATSAAGVALAITSADADDLPTLKTLTLEITTAQIEHGLDSETTRAPAQHSALDAALDEPAGAASYPAEPADLAECQAVLNQIKADLNTHLLNATPHRTAGGQGGFAPVPVATSDGSTQGTNETLANALKAAYNLHFKSGIKTFVLLPS